MVDLKRSEIRAIEEAMAFPRGFGYVLDFSDKTITKHGGDFTKFIGYSTVSVSNVKVKSILANFMNLRERLKKSFEKKSIIYWSNLDRTSNLLIILNFSLFFVSELVIKQGYYYTYFSLFCLAIVKIGLLLPVGLLGKIWYYIIFLILEFVAIYFLVSSVWFWVVTSI